MPQYGDTSVRPRPPQPPAQRRAVPAPVRPRPTASPAPAPQAGPAPAGGTGNEVLDYSSDPILQNIRGLIEQQNAASEAAANAARTQALIRFGFSPELAGLYDSNSAEAARQNKFSTLANLAYQHDARVRNLDDNLSKAGGFYSSYRGVQLGNEGHQYLGEQAGAQSALQDLLGNIAGGLAGSKMAGQDRLIGAEQDAYSRALQFGEKYGSGTGLGGSPLVAGGRTAIPTNRPARPRAPLPRAAAPRARPAPPRRYGQVE